MVGAGFQSDVEICILRLGSCSLERNHFGMISSLVEMISVTHDLTLSHHDRSDQGIGTHPAHPSTGQSNCLFHEALMKGLRVFHWFHIRFPEV